MHKRALQLLFGFILVSLTAGNLWAAMSACVLRQLARLGKDDPPGTLPCARNA